MTVADAASLLAIALVLIGGGVAYLYSTLVRPQWISNALGFTLGAVPLARLPFTPVPLPLVLIAAVGICVLLHRRTFDHLTRIEYALVALIGASAASVPANTTGVTDLRLFLQWAAATAITLLLLRVDRAHLRRCGQWFVGGTAVGAAFGIVDRFHPVPGLISRALTFLGYQPGAFATRFAYGDGPKTPRLIGTYADPNAAAVILLVALLVAATVFRGWSRLGVSMLFVVAIGLTLSRAVGLSIVVGVLVVVAIGQVSRSARVTMMSALCGAAVLALAVPATRLRILSSFGSADAGSSARWEALVAYPDVMSGHWLFGLGWGRKEFWDPATAVLTNYVSNAPLIVIYRGGILPGIAFVLVVAFAVVVSYRCVRSGRFDWRVLGAGFIGFAVVGMQLDHPIVTSPVVTSAFAILLAFVADAGRRLDAGPGQPVTPLEQDGLVEVH